MDVHVEGSVWEQVTILTFQSLHLCSDTVALAGECPAWLEAAAARYGGAVQVCHEPRLGALGSQLPNSRSGKRLQHAIFLLQ